MKSLPDLSKVYAKSPNQAYADALQYFKNPVESNIEPWILSGNI
jgi:hypothetical protein